MFEEYIKDGVLDIEELEEDLFSREYEDCTFEYPYSRHPDLDYENARMTWETNGMFEEVVRERLECQGYEECGGDRVYGQFVWIRELDLLMVRPEDIVPYSARKSLTIQELEDVEFASGVVCSEWFYPETTAERVNA